MVIEKDHWNKALVLELDGIAYPVRIRRDHPDLLPDLLRRPPRLGGPLRTPQTIGRVGQARVAMGEERAHPKASGQVDGRLEHLLDRLGAG
jgi:hypothetical protein